MDLFGNNHHENLLPFKGEAYYYPAFFDRKESDRYFKLLQEEIQWKQEPIWLFGKKVLQPRLTALYGDPSIPYGYSGIEMQSFEWLDFLKEIKERIEEKSQTEFTHVLLNHYRDGQDSMGWHRDNEQVLGHNPVIASLSFGVPRKFQFRLYQNKAVKKELILEHGSFLLMTGETQIQWEHQLPKSTRVHGARINLTFRKISR